MNQSATPSMRRRMIGVLVGFVLLGFTILIVQLFRIQILNGEKYQARAAQQQTRSTTLGAERGTIYDRNGNALARSATVWNVCVSPADMTNIPQSTINKLAAELGTMLEVEPDYIKEQIDDSKYYYKLIKRRINNELRDQVLKYVTENEIPGVFFEVDTKRFYTYGSLASTVLGFTNFDNHGAYGLEAYYDKALSGTPGVIVSTKNALGSDMHHFKEQQINAAKNGNDLVLTIDEGVQHFLEKHLETAIVEHSIRNRASGIVMDIKTGEILAMATKGDFDPNEPNVLTSEIAITELEELSETFPEETEEYQKRLQELRYDQWRNKAISDTYEPGSVFKIITAATALDNKKVTLEDGFYCGGFIEVATEEIGCHKRTGHGQLNFLEGMRQSCNPVFITIGQRVGGEALYQYMDNFGLRAPTGIDLPGEAEGILHTKGELLKEGKVELSSTSFGQTFKVTPLQMITAVSAAINDGKLMQPYIVKQIRDPEGNVIETTQPTVKRQVVSAETSATVRELVEAVVDGGSGRHAAIPGYRIGGKTGTSEKLDERGNRRNILSFVGFAPMEDPRYAVLVMLDEPHLDNVYGSVIAAPVVGAILQEMLPYLGISPTYTEEELAETEIEMPYLIGWKPHDAQSKLTELGLQTNLVGVGGTVVQQIPQAGTTVNRGRTVTLYTDEAKISDEVTVPDVLGMTAQEANKAIVGDVNLNIELRGVTTDGVPTVVIEQWPLPGTLAKTGEVVIVTMAEKPQDDEGAEEEDTAQ